MEAAGHEIAIHGTVSDGFEPVADAFRANFAERGEVGAACAAYFDGRLVVDLWGGVADPDDGRPWKEDTLLLVRSVTKGATATCAHLLAQRGDLDLDAPVARYWPEFAAHGKDAIPVSWLLSHRAGLPALDERLPFEDSLRWEPIAEALAAQRPLWEPGTRHGYHGLTFGWLVGEVIRRISGRTAGRFFADEIAGPLGLEFWIGLPPEQQHRVGRLLAPRAPVGLDPERLPDDVRRIAEAARDPCSLLKRMGLTSPPVDDFDNSPEVHAVEMPAHNGITTARSAARMYAAMIGDVDGIRLLEPATIARASATQSIGMDEVILRPTHFGLGYALDSPFAPYGTVSSFGHPGAGGSMAFGDPDSGIAFAYVMNLMVGGMYGDVRATNLVDAVRACTR